MKAIIPITLALLGFFSNILGQEPTYNTKFNLTICTTTRNAEAELLVRDSIGNLFTGVLIVDNEERKIFGWYTEKKSEGAGFIYNTEGIVFYVELNKGFQHQQLFKGLFNFDKTTISGTYFYWGNEFIFYGTKENIQTVKKSIQQENQLRIYPNPVDDYLIIDLIESPINCKIYDSNGKVLFDKETSNTLNVSGLKSGSYILEVLNNKNDIKKIKFIKR